MSSSHPPRHSRPSDSEIGVRVDDGFERFHQRDEIFCRSRWDPQVESGRAGAFYAGHDMPQAKARNVDGYTQLDYALRNAAWHMTHALRDLDAKGEGRREGFNDAFTLHGPGSASRVAFNDPEQAAREIKQVAKTLGADLVGICANDPRWLYASRFGGPEQDVLDNEVPDDLPWVIVTAEAMDHGLTATVPSALSGTATGIGYMWDTVTLVSLAQYIRNLGYRAVATMNDSALAVPLALQAGLGEYGRHSLLITREFGPRVRLGKVFTDLPLSADAPVRFGVREYCEICNKCATSCPPKAIDFGVPAATVHNRSNLKGVVKWTTDAEKCFRFWANQNSDCSICIRVCPYNKDFSKVRHRLWRWLAGTRFRKVARWLDDKLGMGARQTASAWWGRE